MSETLKNYYIDLGSFDVQANSDDEAYNIAKKMLDNEEVDIEIVNVEPH